MKLLSVTARANRISILLVLLFSAAALFIILRIVILEELHEQLTLKAQRIETAISNGQEYYDPFTTISEVPDINRPLPDIFSDTLVYDNTQQEYEDYRMFETTRRINNRWYKIKTSTSRVEWEEFIWIIFAVFFGCLILLLLIMQWVNLRLTKKIWTPFFNNLRKIQGFSLNSKTDLSLQSSDVEEFEELNTVLLKMTSKIQNDYRSLKDFSENASHEIQTPLAIILSGLDQLLQSPSLDESSAEKVESVKQAATRLSKLNRNLLLLTKIENAQFSQLKPINLTSLLSQQCTLMEDLFKAKGIKLNINLPHEIVVQADPQLSEILLSNLLANCHKHTKENSTVSISSSNKDITFSNPGSPLPVNSEKLFERFYKSSDQVQSHGLGLSIASQICITYGWSITYEYSNGQHHFTLKT